MVPVGIHQASEVLRPEELDSTSKVAPHDSSRHAMEPDGGEVVLWLGNELPALVRFMESSVDRRQGPGPLHAGVDA